MALIAKMLTTLSALGNPLDGRMGPIGNYDVAVEFQMEATRNVTPPGAVSAGTDAAAQPPEIT